MNGVEDGEEARAVVVGEFVATAWEDWWHAGVVEKVCEEELLIQYLKKRDNKLIWGRTYPTERCQLLHRDIPLVPSLLHTATWTS